MKLNEIKDNPGSRKKRTIVGRGIGSGLGKTAGMGHKGQRARCGHGLNGFEGGQTPIYRRLPKRGFVNPSRQSVYELDFFKINRLLSKGFTKIDRDLLVREGYMPKYIDVISLVNNGAPQASVTLAITRATAKAKEALEAAGGKLEIE